MNRPRWLSTVRCLRRHVEAKLPRENVGVFIGLDAQSLNRVDAERHASPNVFFLNYTARARLIKSAH
jgi:hypothetical protein